MCLVLVLVVRVVLKVLFLKSRFLFLIFRHNLVFSVSSGDRRGLSAFKSYVMSELELFRT